ncbi:tRNA preQ1(34) S-adenosylmethionine ribosyltransferase-isomerase QueA [Moraxella bovis]|uniref:tRNA preQ1(34) S-adenosylmethionine ribosyltransferase-isomerase QueA n=1 Tax=Moraxella bovis TaxID=476 RepID=UPI0022274DC2|nr:tRNA preQ1(34) S-adenosylmethionine ribosyltransferase-isomerase QueA [Moraxella bovis]UYZ74860.1 tRNA preQ1(34) S-adenosylmethionine ribosyltransferase-isomerase QueA [Moraxella bovis]UYZ79212.1 tRNA preQ1(34) S-adenosylmethionine ribosyltransferase-isomerase QueA [Moraxella bovis]UYZ87692.1 tRNA preQ1(34) S-adenosylmethionine ribosyltransferase-isomerase QueA [Moraxella bovis]UYZ93113.1 tRNA preQ1(34) S-adenosylmethionine ribosyltransferase-isomerase QueA [Moraxella bovis]UYZ96965.1 tRNA 
MNTPLLTADFDYHLPDELIARYPLAVRSGSRLLHVQGDTLADLNFSDLPDLLNKGDLLVLNDTKVMKARLFGVKDTGGAVEVLIERITDHDNHIAYCHVRSSRALKVGQTVSLADESMTATMCGRAENLFVLQFDAPILADLERYGQMPIPPYFERTADDTDDTRYQTVFHDPAKQASVAAPTASLHFDDETLQKLANRGVEIAFVTLHVGAGTFAPVKADDLTDHIMHAEYAHLPQATADKINATKAQGGQVIAVGTTVTRTLETAHLHRVDGQLAEFSGDTQIFIYPPYEFGVVDRLITNFHLPKSTLLMLVSAFAGTDNIKNAYAHAIDKKYRFFSYGDAMILDKG